jgi:TATA-binding protein-associated factor
MFGGLLRHYIVSASMLQRLLTATIVEEWAREAEKCSLGSAPLASYSPFAEELGQTMLAFLDNPAPEFYHEMALNLTKLLQDCTSLLAGFSIECRVAPNKIPNLGKTIDITGRGEDPDTFTLEKARMTIGVYFQNLKTSLGRTKKKEVATLEDRRKLVAAAIDQYETTKTRHDTRVSAAFAAAVVALRIQMPKLTPIIKSLTAGVRVSNKSFVLDTSSLSSASPKTILTYSNVRRKQSQLSSIYVRASELRLHSRRLSKIFAHSYVKTLSSHQPSVLVLQMAS